MYSNRNIARISGRERLGIKKIRTHGGLCEEYYESRRCARHTYPESYFTECTSKRRRRKAVAVKWPTALFTSSGHTKTPKMR